MNIIIRRIHIVIDDSLQNWPTLSNIYLSKEINIFLGAYFLAMTPFLFWSILITNYLGGHF